MSIEMANGMQMTLEMYAPEIFLEPIYGVSEHLVRTSQSQETEQGLAETEVPSLEKYLESLGKLKKKIDPSGLSTRMLRECLAVIRDGITSQFSWKWMRGGYDIEWQIFNSKFYRVPQNRERVYTIGHLRAKGQRTVLPIEGADGKDSVQIIQIGHQPNANRQNSNCNRVYDPRGSSPCLNSMQGGGLEPCVPVRMFGIDYSDGGKEREVANCLSARYDNGVSRHKQEGTAVGVVIPVLTPDRAEKRQNGRRFKENGDESFTLTAQDRHGVAIQVREATSKGYAEAHEGDSINLALPNSQTRRDRVGYQVAQTLDTSCNQGTIEVIEGEPPKTDHPGMYVQLDEECTVWAVWYEKYQCYIAIRKLTPKECFRLQGWTDEYFERAEFVNSNSQLYKQAGNGVTVNVVYEIAKRL